MKSYYNIILTIFILGSLNAHTEGESLETSVAIGKSEKPFESDVAGSVDVLNHEELAYEHVDGTLELLGKVPGVYNGSIRGFSSGAAKLLIDGIPANLHSGYSELDQLFPLSIESIAVVKGTSDPRYGLYNIAGNYNVTTRLDDARQIELTLGSFNTLETQIYVGFSNEEFTHSYGIGYRSNEGYRDHSDLEKYSFSGKWQWEIDEGGKLAISVRHAGYDGNSPGYLTQQQARDNPRQSSDFFNQNNDKETNYLGLHWDQESSQQDLRWQFRVYNQTFETEFRSPTIRSGQSGSLGDFSSDQTQWGVISMLNVSLSEDWSLDWGIDYEFQEVFEQILRFSYSTMIPVNFIPHNFDNFDYEFSHYGTYIQINHRPNKEIWWNISLRLDQLDGSFTLRSNAGNRVIYDFGMITQPKFNIVYAPSSAVNLFANIGRSFQHPSGSTAYFDGSNGFRGVFRGVSINDGWEVGIQWIYSPNFNARLSYWQQNASNERVFIDFTPRNVGKTERFGVDLAFNCVLNNEWSCWGSFTTIETEIIRTSNTLDTRAGSEGNELPNIPSYVASFGINYQPTESFIIRAHVDNQGDYHVNAANVGGTFGEYTIVNLSMDYTMNWGVVKVQLNNLTDEYYEYVFDLGETYHFPGDGFNGSVSINWDF